MQMTAHKKVGNSKVTSKTVDNEFIIKQLTVLEKEITTLRLRLDWMQSFVEGIRIMVPEK